ncbi:MAG TPA: YtxH domain-containing protein [Nitrospira sp.]|nr:YtxH domain-containing protein [Nitrospira sp.]
MMNNRMSGSVRGGLLFVAGVIVGGGAGLLLAPASGARIRRRLTAVAQDLGEEIGNLAADARTKINQVIERGRRLAA